MDLEEVFGYPKMYVVDGSILQANPGVNHSFSISALAEYATDQIRRKVTIRTFPLLLHLTIPALLFLSYRQIIVIRLHLTEDNYLIFLIFFF